jgi:hypothetical protein
MPAETPSRLLLSGADRRGRKEPMSCLTFPTSRYAQPGGRAMASVRSRPPASANALMSIWACQGRSIWAHRFKLWKRNGF